MQRIFISTLFITILSLGSCCAGPLGDQLKHKDDDRKEWSILMYMNTNQLESWAIQNLNDAASTLRDKTTNLFAFCNHQPNRAWLWRVKHGELKQEQFVEQLASHEDNIVDLMKWIKKKHPAKRYAIVLWGCVSGVIDCTLNCETNTFKYPKEGEAQTCEACLIDGRVLKKSILVDDASQTQLSNDDLIDTLVGVKEVLGQPLDTLITDACAMANLELVARMDGLVTCFTGTQDCEMADGLPYNVVMNHLNKRDVSAQELTTTIVREYGAYHDAHAQEGRHTYVAAEVTHPGEPRIADLLDLFYGFAEAVEAVVTEHPEYADALYALRDTAIESSVYSEYIDARAWVHAAASALASCDEQGELCELVADFDELFSQVVLANTAGTASAGKHGLSLYYPRTWVHPSFRDQERAWNRLLAASTQYWQEKTIAGEA